MTTQTIYDISVPFAEGMTAWPGSPGFHAERYKSLDRGDRSNDTRLTMDVHVGTHIESPLHTVLGGASVETLSWEQLYGTALVADVRGYACITADVLQARVAGVACERLLLKTDNEDVLVRPHRAFDTAFVGLSVDGAQWVVDHGCRLIGNDYLSVAAYGQGHEVHRTLFERGVAVLEGVHLSHVDPGVYTLFCAPLLLRDCEASPARALLLTP